MFKSLFSKKKKPEAPRENSNNNEPDRNLQKREFDTVLNAVLGDSDAIADAETYAVFEVECLWSRYQQLSDDSGMPVEDNTLLQQEPFVSDPFLRQIWKTIPRDDNNKVTFPAFYGVIKWWQTADVEMRLRGIFKLLNGEQPLDRPALVQIISTTNPDLDMAGSEQMINLLLAHVDDKDQGFIDEDQWMQAFQGLPGDLVTNITAVEIIPDEERNGTRQNSNHQSQPSQVSRVPSHASIPDEMLINISAEIGERDWLPLAVKLGLQEREIQSAKRHYPNRSREQIYQILSVWNKKNSASKQTLAQALQSCGMEEVVTLLEM